MADLTVNLCGLELRNPFVLAAGPLSWNATGIRAAFSAGAGAVVTKTIRPQATVNPMPHIAALKGGSALNTEGWSDLPAEQWINQELPALADRDGVLIVSLGHTPAEVEALAAPLAQAGADLLELVSYQAEDAAAMVRAARRSVCVPVLIKVSANWHNLLEVVDACLEAGADGVTAIDSIGPTLRVDVETGRPLLDSFAWLSGAAIRPIALRAVAEICLRHDVPVVGTGGVLLAQDAVEMIMAGAVAVGVCTAPLLRGLSFFAKTTDGLGRWLDTHGHNGLEDIRGLALPYLRDVETRVPFQFRFRPELCTDCRLCADLCPYQARQVDESIPGPDGQPVPAKPGDKQRLDRTRCRWCGLCVSVCKPRALTWGHLPGAV